MTENSFMKANASNLTRDLAFLLNNQDLSDVEFIIGGERKKYFAHKCILSARCEVFRAMFSTQNRIKQSSNKKPSPLVLKDMKHSTFYSMLEYLYANGVSCAEKTVEEMIDLMSCAIEYGLEDLRKICQDYLSENLTVENVCTIMTAAANLGQDYLKKACRRYFDEHAKTVMVTKGFNSLPEDAVVEIVMSDDLDMDEMDIIEAIRNWALSMAYENHQMVTDVGRRVASQVRLSLLSPEELSKVEQENIKERIIPAEGFVHAWKAHALKRIDPINPLTRRRKGTKLRECHKLLV